MPAHADPTRVRDQPALRGGAPARWLVPTALLGAVAIALLVLTLPIAPVVAWVGIALQVGLFVSMAICAAVLPAGRRRGYALAILMIGMAVAALVSLLLLLAIARSPSG